MTSAQVQKGITSLIVAAVFAAILIGSFSTAHAAVKAPSPSSGFWSFFGVFGWGASDASVGVSGTNNINSVGVRIR